MGEFLLEIFNTGYADHGPGTVVNSPLYAPSGVAIAGNRAPHESERLVAP